MLSIKYDEIIYNEETVLKAGEIYFDKGITLLVGENGSGKSTLLNIISRQINADSSEIKLDNTIISDIDISDYKNSCVTYVSQTNKLFPEQTVVQTIQLILGVSNSDVISKIAFLLNFDEVIKRNPKVKKMSGGEKQKLKILCGLAADNPIILLDEPFNNLDKDSIEKINAFLNNSDKYVIVTSHIDFIEEYKQYHILDKEICSVQSLNYGEEIEIKKSKKLKTNSLKGLRKQNKKIRYPLYFINFVVVILLSFAIINNLNIYRQATSDRSNFVYGESVTTIKPPISNSYFSTFGSEKWLNRTKTYFDDNDIMKLENLSYVKNVTPIKSDGYAAGGIDYKNKYLIDISEENTEFSFTSALYEKQVAEGMPLLTYSTNVGQIEKFKAGTFPDDESSEVMLDTVAADYVLEHSKYTSYDDLVGEIIYVPTIEKDDGERKTLDFEVSGVFQPTESLDKSITKGTIVTSFSIDNKYVHSTYTQFESRDEIYERLKQTLEISGIDSTYITPDDIPKPGYDSLFIETENPEDVELLTKEIQNYDQFIEIENNYLYNQSINFKYLNKVIYKNILLIVILLLLFCCSLVLLFKLYKIRLFDTINTLNFYGFNTKEQIRFLKFEMKEYLTTIAIINLVASVYIQFGKINSFDVGIVIISNIILYIINYIILAFILKKSKYSKIT